MSYNDGQKLMVFGLGFAQQDSRKMQHLLCHYDRLPSNPGSRTALFVELSKLAKELMTDEAAHDQIQQLTDWMQNGGDFPFRVTPKSSNAAGVHGRQPSEAGEASVRGQRVASYSRASRPGLSGSLQFYGGGRTFNDTPEDDNQSAASSKIVAEVDDNNDAEPSDHVSMERNGKGRTINDLPEALNLGEDDEDMGDTTEDSGDYEAQNLDDTTQWGTRAGWNDYGQGRTLNDPGVTEDNLIGDGDPKNEDEDPHEESQIEPAIIEPTTAPADIPHNNPSTPTDEPHEQIECPICLEEYPPSNFPKRNTITEFCDHPDLACLPCLDSSITVMVERGALHLLACPICPQKLSHHDIKEYSNDGIYERYKYLKQQSEIPGHWISCTNPDCGGSQPHESEDPMMICNHCTFATCAKHKRPWHKGQTCREFDMDDAQIERLEEEEATAKLLAKEATSICPKCGQGITKTAGCDHMRCQCGQEWCYVVRSPSSHVF